MTKWRMIREGDREMCGIAGIWDRSWKNSPTAVTAVLEAMAETLRRRGPDERSVFADAGGAHFPGMEGPLANLNLFSVPLKPSRPSRSAFADRAKLPHRYLRHKQGLRRCGLPVSRTRLVSGNREGSGRAEWR
jgi:hypothetical protein